jgi:tRNA-splicing endonuclease subunit Sen34
MSLGADSVKEPISISVVAGRYLLFDINIVTYLRKTYNICGVLIGSIPQIPQQNTFLGLPLELLPEEVKLLVQKGVAYIVDAASWHKEMFSTLKGEERKKYLQSLRLGGQEAQRAAEKISQKKAERGLAKQALQRAQKISPSIRSVSQTSIAGVDTTVSALEEDDPENALFDSRRSLSPARSTTSTSQPITCSITPTVTYSHATPPHKLQLQPDPPVPSSYPLFAHLHSHSYFITPGLRFGCDYTVYPGDPLRFHSHFLAVGYGWDEEIPLLDLVGGGRLCTGVKKGFLIGGSSPTSTEADNEVRTFCIEWGGM